MTDSDSSRRNFLAAAGVGTAGLAGCVGQLGDDQDDQPEGSPAGGERTVTMMVQPDPTALRNAQIEVTSAYEDGELEEEEAMEELAEREQQLIDVAIADASDLIEEAGGTHVDTVSAEGTMLVEGEATALLDLLEQPSVSAILSESRFQQAREREEAGQAGTDEAELPDDVEDPDYGDSTDDDEQEENESTDGDS